MFLDPAFFPTVISIFVVSLMSLSGIFILLLGEGFLKKMMMYLVSFAAGAIFANVFAHILPEVAELSQDIHTSFLLVFVGIIVSFMVETFVHWHHCHSIECHSEHVHPLGTMMLVGDTMHNIIDGILIATAFVVDMQLGIATTIVVMLHEIPQEIGDFAILLHSGFSKARALMWNLLSALTAFVGAGLVLFLRSHVEGIEMILLPLVAGNFLYIAGADLIPELHKETNIRRSALQFLWLLAGAALIYLLTAGGH